MSCSWVTSTIVSPSRLSRCMSASTSTLVRGSRLPVGSSASITAGSLMSARAIATRCCWPPESWLGGCDSRSASAAIARGHARVLEGQLDVLERARPRQEVELLEDEADLRVPDPGERVRRQAGDILTAEHVAAGGGRVEAAQEVHEGGLAG